MKKTKLFASLATLGTLAAATPIVVTGCSSESESFNATFTKMMWNDVTGTELSGAMALDVSVLDWAKCTFDNNAMNDAVKDPSANIDKVEDNGSSSSLGLTIDPDYGVMIEPSEKANNLQLKLKVTLANEKVYTVSGTLNVAEATNIVTAEVTSDGETKQLSVGEMIPSTLAAGDTIQFTIHNPSETVVDWRGGYSFVNPVEILKDYETTGEITAGRYRLSDNNTVCTWKLDDTQVEALLSYTTISFGAYNENYPLESGLLGGFTTFSYGIRYNPIDNFKRPTITPASTTGSGGTWTNDLYLPTTYSAEIRNGTWEMQDTTSAITATANPTLTYDVPMDAGDNPTWTAIQYDDNAAAGEEYSILNETPNSRKLSFADGVLTLDKSASAITYGDVAVYIVYRDSKGVAVIPYDIELTLAT